MATVGKSVIGGQVPVAPGISLQVQLPEPFQRIKTTIHAAELAFKNKGSGPEKLEVVAPVAFETLTVLVGPAKGEKAEAAAKKFASALVDWGNAIDD